MRYQTAVERRLSTSLQNRLVALAGVALAVATLTAAAANSDFARGLMHGWRDTPGRPEAKVVQRIPVPAARPFTAG